MKVKVVVLSSVICIIVIGLVTIQLAMENHELKAQIYKKEALILNNILVRKYRAVDNENDVLMNNAINEIDILEPLHGEYYEGSRGRYFLSSLQQGGRNIQSMGDNFNNRVQIRDIIGEMQKVIWDYNDEPMNQKTFNKMVTELIPLAEKYLELTK